MKGKWNGDGIMDIGDEDVEVDEDDEVDICGVEDFKRFNPLMIDADGLDAMKR
jgi:hypothetical protein